MNYLEIINIVLRDTNEVPLNATSFTNARGFHAFVKEAVNRALMDIANESEEWTWLANVPMDRDKSIMSNSFDTDRKVAVYDFPDGISEVDWDSFIAVDNQEKEARPLKPISFEDWQRYLSGDTLNSRDETRLGAPSYVFRTKDNKGIGFSPVPDKAYTINYLSWKEPQLLNNATDSIPFPDRFYGVLVNRTLYYVWKFRDNVNQAQLAQNAYDAGITNMKRALIKTVFQTMRAV